MLLARLDRSFKSAINDRNKKYLPDEKAYHPFTKYAAEDIVTALYQRTAHYRAFFHNLDGVTPLKQQGNSFTRIIVPLNTGFIRKVRDIYFDLKFTDYQVGGKQNIRVQVESYAHKTPYKNDQQLHALLKHHLRHHLLSTSLNDINSFRAEYYFYSDYAPFAGVIAHYKNGGWSYRNKDTSSMQALKRPPSQEELRQIAKAEAAAELLKSRPPKIKNGKYSEKQILAYIKKLQDKTNELLKEWPQYQSKPLSHLGRRDHQTKMIELARDKIPKVIDDVLPSALFLLQNIDKDNTEDYSQWDRKISKPIRTVLGDGLTLWDHGFNNDEQKRVQLYYGHSSYTDPFTHAKIRHSISNLMTYQFDWVRQNREGTSADPYIEIPMGISGSESKIIYKEPRRIRFRLDSPTEIFFEGIGQQAGQAGAAFLSYKGRLASYEQKLIDQRKSYFECYPDCKNFRQITSRFSRLLIEKDIHYLKLSGNYNPLSDRLTRGLSALAQATNIKLNNLKLLDGGVPYRCLGVFQTWGYDYSQALDTDLGNEMNRSLEIMGHMTKGNMGAIRKAGESSREEQQSAFNESFASYGAYQICRDQWELDHWEATHGEFDDKSS